MLPRLLVIAATVACLFGVLELTCRALPVSTSTDTGYHHHPDILNYPAHHEWWAATGWDLRNAQRLRSNNLGFAAHRDFVPNERAVALIGDSFVEASMLPEAARPGMQLEAALSGRPVYAMGGPGSSLLDYADRIQLARQQLQVRDIVILLEAGDVRQAICGSGNVHSACLAPGTLTPRRERQPSAGALKRALRHSAAAQYLASQLRVQPQQLVTKLSSWFGPTQQRAQIAEGVGGLDAVATDAVLKEFFGRLGPAQGYGQVLFAVDGRHDPKGPPLAAGLQTERMALMTAARAWGALVLDAEEAYAAHQARSKRSLDVGPYDHHLNGLGVQVLFGAVAKRLEGQS